MRFFSTFFLVLIAIAGLAGPAAAHRQPTTETTIEPLEDGTFGITHRFHTHDVIRVLLADPEIGQPDPTDLEHQARFALYVAHHFEIALPGGEMTAGRQPVEAGILGAEMAGDYFFVYQELTLPAGVDALWFRSTLLSELGEQWNSRLNFRTGSGGQNGDEETIRSASFGGRSNWQKIEY